jgi:L-cysteine/cystine lyase
VDAVLRNLRSQFPVFERIAYLNAGTCGPIPAASLRAGADVALAAAENGRAVAYYEEFLTLRGRLRESYAALLGAAPGDVAVTSSTSGGMVSVLLGLGLQAGDEVLTADDEHPGLLGPLAAAQRLLGITVRTAPLARLHEEVGPGTRLVACSHVSWITGQVVAARALAEAAGPEVPVLLDGAQGIGAVALDMKELGCAFYAGSGQKWLCGPVGTGALYVSPGWRERLTVPAPVYPNLEVPSAGLAAEPWPDARAFDVGAQSVEGLAFALASLDVLHEPGWPAVHERAATLAARFAAALTESGRTVALRDATTLVAWESPDPEAERDRLAAAGVVVRHLPGTSYVRASVGAWNDEDDLDRLLAALGPA